MSQKHLLFFSVLLLAASPISATGIFDILNETVYTGNWSITSMEYNLPPDGGCSIAGRVWVVYGAGCAPAKRGKLHCRAYADEYRNCRYKDSGNFGDTICRGDGCWVHMVSGSNFFVTERVFDKQTNHTKELILEKCGGVVENDWEPFLGHPNNPYDVEVQNDGVVWGYVKIHFNQLSQIEGEYCIPNEDSIIIHSGSWEEVGAKQWKKKKWQRGVWSIEDETTYEIIDGIITAQIKITVQWYHSRGRDDGSCSYNNHTSVVVFYDSVPMPRVLDIAINASATIVCHNNSVSPYSLIDVHIDDNVTMTEITYRNQTYTYHNKIGLLTDDDTYTYFDFINEPIWSPDRHNAVTRRAGYYVINEAPIDEIRIDVSTPYQTKEITDYNVTLINSTLSDHVGFTTIIAFLAILGVFVLTGYSLWRKL